MKETPKAIYNKAKMLSSFLDDDDKEVIASVQEELLSIPISYLQVLKELRLDMTSTKAILHLDRIIGIRERAVLTEKLTVWAKGNENIIIACDLLAQLEPCDNAAYDFVFEVFLLGKEAFLKTPFESSSVIEVLEALHYAIMDFSTLKNYADNRVYRLLRHTLPEDIADSLYMAIIYKYIGETFDYPLNFLRSGEGFVMGFKNTGEHKIEFIDDPYLIIFQPEKNKYLKCMSPISAIGNGVITDFDVMENVDFLIMMAGMMQKSYTDMNEHDKANWLKDLTFQLSAL